MLTTLRIKNLALVVDLTLELHPGLNVITGETGAGKSVLIKCILGLMGPEAGSIRIDGEETVGISRARREPLMRKFGVESTARASFYFYNTTDEIDRLVEVLREIQKFFAT